MPVSLLYCCYSDSSWFTIVFSNCREWMVHVLCYTCFRIFICFGVLTLIFFSQQQMHWFWSIDGYISRSCQTYPEQCDFLPPGRIQLVSLSLFCSVEWYDNRQVSYSYVKLKIFIIISHSLPFLNTVPWYSKIWMLWYPKFQNQLF